MKMRTEISLWRLPMTALAFLAAATFAGQAALADTLHATDDAYVYLDGKKAKKKYGKAQTLIVKAKGVGEGAYLRFDLATLPEGASVDQAVLRIWVSKVAKPGKIDVLLVEDDWNEDTIIGLTAVTFATSYVDTIEVAKEHVNDFYVIPLTEVVQDWLDGAENFGIALLPYEPEEGEDPNKVDVVFDSKENVKTSHQPELEVVALLESPERIVPTNAVMAFAAGSCPAGWTRYSAADGRYIVGWQSGTSVGRQIGARLGANEERNNTGPHSHVVDPPNTGTSTTGNHWHSVIDFEPDFTTERIYGALDGNRTYANVQDTETHNTSTAGNHSHSVNIAAFGSGTTGTSATNAPYIVLMMCRKL